MSRRRGRSAAASVSRQLGSSDRRHRRANQISTQDSLGDTIERNGGNLELKVSTGLRRTSAGVEIIPAAAAANAVDTTDIVAKFNALLVVLRAADILEE